MPTILPEVKPVEVNTNILINSQSQENMTNWRNPLGALTNAAWSGVNLAMNVGGTALSVGKFAATTAATGLMLTVPYQLGAFASPATFIFSSIPTVQNVLMGYDTSLTSLFSEETKNNYPGLTNAIGKLPAYLTYVPSIVAVGVMLGTLQPILIPLITPHVGELVAGYIATGIPLVTNFAQQIAPYTSYAPILLASFSSSLCLYKGLHEIRESISGLMTSPSEVPHQSTQVTIQA